MKCITVFLVLFGSVLSQLDYDFSNAEDVTYNFYNKKSESALSIHSNDISKLQDVLDVKKNTVFLIYGYEDPAVIEDKMDLKSKILNQEDINLFIVDWSFPTSQSYLEAQENVVKIGTYISDFIQNLEKQYELDLQKTIFIGFDLGAHIAGVAGKSLSGKISTIVGLDPAGPLFTERNTDNRLTSDDAVFVQVIHTNSLINGYPNPCGHADYYPNNGTTQNSCGKVDATGVCSHQRALSFYGESLSTDKFVAVSCSDYDSYKSGLCANNEQSSMGQFSVDTTAQGTYYLDTNDVAPYAKG